VRAIANIRATSGNGVARNMLIGACKVQLTVYFASSHFFASS
jgi:hypothetical protein